MVGAHAAPTAKKSVGVLVRRLRTKPLYACLVYLSLPRSRRQKKRGKNLSQKRRSSLEVSTVTRTLGRLVRRIPAASQRRRRRGEDKLILKEHASYSKTT